MLTDELPLALVEWARLVEDLVRHGELADVVELRCSGELVELVAPQSEHRACLHRERRNAFRVNLESRLAFGEPVQEGVQCPVCLATSRVLLGVESLVREAERIARVCRLVGKHDRPERARDVEALAVLGECGARAIDERLGFSLRDRCDEAELVSTEAVDRTVLARYSSQLCTEAREQRISRRVAEAVVVALEPVEVEDHEESRDRMFVVQPAFQVGDELAPIGQACQRIRDRLVPRKPEETTVLSERADEAEDDEENRRCREHECEQVDPVEVVGHEDAGGDDRAGRRYREQGAALDLEPARVALTHPRRRRDEDHRGWPENVEHGSLHVGSGCVLEEVDGVGDRGREYAEPEDEPETSGSPAGEREDAEDGGEKENVTQRVREYGGVEVETPIMYDFEHPALASYLNRFPARQYVVKSEDKELFLRFSACFGQFLMAKDLQISYRQLPFRIYELTRYSFRREKSGEVSGLRRLRAFTMPDCHAICRNLDQAKEEALKRFNLSLSVLEGVGLSKDDFEYALRFTKQFYNENKEFLESLVQKFGRPALAEMWDERFFYFVFKWEFNFVDNLDKASALSTDQIDVENAERYGITYIDEDDTRRYPIILHNSPSGAIERCIYALLEKAHRVQTKGGTPTLPLWLSPAQVRLLPLNPTFEEHAEKLADELEKAGIRVDVDDRDETVSKRIRTAETEWIPYIAVIGEKEVSSGVLQIRDRESGGMRNLTSQELLEEIKRKTEGKPYLPLPLPRSIKKRPQFPG